jgi:peptidoglycan/xylan/chitin deacetylase (PgdA/CDA1 family)
MKIIFTFLIITLSKGYCSAQIDTVIAKTGYPIEMLFPQGKTKALILSYDDGRTADRQLVTLMNKYGLIGTFHLNSNKLGSNGYLNKDEIKTLFKGHEVSVHSANHPNLNTLSKFDIVYEVVEDRKELERLMGYPVRGMAYPFGNNNEFVLDAMKGLGIEYARTVADTYNYNIPENFLQWHPTVHQFAKAFWEPNNPVNDKKELDRFYQLINEFISTKQLAVLDIWGHSWEMGDDQTKWEETEKFLKMLANNPNIYYGKQIEIVDYILAFRNLKFSVEKNWVYNPSALTIFFKLKETTYSIDPGNTIKLAF